MTPEQITLVTQTVAALRPRMEEVAEDFYARLFTRHPELRGLFTEDPAVQRRKFADELEMIIRVIPEFSVFVDRVRSLGARHVSYGVRVAHYAQVRVVLFEAIAAALEDRWTDELALAWHGAYDMITEVMLLGATPARPRIARR
jgi:hemoglobin-like flavoprotein